MYESALASSFHGMIATPSTPVIIAPVLKLMCRGAMCAKSFAGLTTFAAMFVLIVAIATPTSASTAITTRIAGLARIGSLNPAGGVLLVICESTNTGSHSFAGSTPLSRLAEALVITTAIALNAIIVVGRPIVCPTICARWSRPNRVKSGMFSESVAQNPIMPVSDGTNTFQNSAAVANFDGLSSSSPTPPARDTSHTRSHRPITRISGADQFSNTRTAFMPTRMIAMFSSQNTANVISDGIASPSTIASPPICPNSGHAATMNVRTASPPMYVWMPNHPHATIARSTAGTFAPTVPKLARASTGNGIPYFVPGCALSRIGTSTIRLPSPIVSSACHQFMPTAIRPPASM